MISMMVVAGVNSKNLANFLTDRGTFAVDFVYNDLHSNVDEIMNQIVKVDKLLYLYQSDDETGSANMNVRADMQALQGLFRHNVFFKPGDIIFLCNSGNISSQAKRYFTAVMTECKKTNYAIKTIEGALSFSAVYDNLIGITKNRDFKNTYLPIYRKERGKDSMIAYGDEDNCDLVIEPFTYDNLRTWEEQKKLAGSLEQSNVLVENSQTHLEKWNSPDFGGIEYKDVVRECKVVLVSGGKKSGKSVWATALALSGIADGRKCGVFDFTGRLDMQIFLEKYSDKFQAVSPKDILNDCAADGPVACLCDSKKYAMDFCHLAVNWSMRHVDVAFIVTELSDAHAFLKVIGGNLHSMIVTAFRIVNDVEEAALALLQSKCRNSYLVLNDVLRIVIDNLMEPEAIKDKYQGIKVIKPVVFKDLRVGPSLYRTVIG